MPKLLPYIAWRIFFPNNGINFSSICININFVRSPEQPGSEDKLKANPQNDEQNDGDISHEEVGSAELPDKAVKALNKDDDRKEESRVVSQPRHEFRLIR